MIINAQDRRLTTEGIHMDYVVFGEGKKILVVTPGLGDGLKTLQGLSKPLAYRYRKYAKDYKVYIFGRRLRMPEGMTAKSMAEDQLKALKRLKIRNYTLLGSGFGSFIARELALLDTEAVNKLVLVQSALKPSILLKDTLEEWIEEAKKDEFEVLANELIKERYGDLKITKPLVQVFNKLKKPQNFSRFIIQATAMKDYGLSEDLEKLYQETLIINGTEDPLFSENDAFELNSQLKDSRVHMIEGGSVILKAGKKAFDDVVTEFLEIEKKESKKE